MGRRPSKDIVYKPSHDDANVRDNKLFLRLPGAGNVFMTIEKGIRSEVHTKKRCCRHKRLVKNTQKEVHVDSVTGIKTDKGHERASAISKDFYRLIKEAVALRKRLSNKKLTDKDPEASLSSIKKIIESVSGYHKETKHLGSGWKRNKANALALVSGLTPSKNGGSEIPKDLHLLIKKAVGIRKHLKTNENDNDSTLKLTSAERSIRYLAWHKKIQSWKYNPVTASTMFFTEKSIVPSQSGDILPDSHGRRQPPPLNPNRKVPNMYCIPLKDEDHKSWLEFRNLDPSTPELDRLSKRSDEQEKRPIGLDHPFVSVIGDFAIAAYNEACEIHVKKGIHNNLHDVKFMECNYLKNTKGYYFYMTIEAIEEGNLGIYEAEVLCNSDDGSRTLSKFAVTDRTPVGKKAMAISYLSRLRSICNAVEGLTDSKVVYILLKYGHGNAGLSLQRSLQISHDKTMKGLVEVLSQDSRLFFSPDYNQTTNQDDWSDPSADFYSGMVRRTNKTTCKGYNYYNPFDIGT